MSSYILVSLYSVNVESFTIFIYMQFTKMFGRTFDVHGTCHNTLEQTFAMKTQSQQTTLM